MSHLDYYKYQAVARGIHGPDDVVFQTRANAYLFEQIVGPWLPEDRSAKVVDLACGHGSFMVWLKQKKYLNALGIDSCPEQVKLARAASLNIEEAEVIGWLESRPERSFDVLFAIDFIEHISKDDLMRLLKSSCAALKTDGRLVLRYPNGDSPFVGLNLFNDITHVWTYTSNCLRTLARMHGFKQVTFADEGRAIRDRKWSKNALGMVCRLVLKCLIRGASRERIQYWNSSIWACLEK